MHDRRSLARAPRSLRGCHGYELEAIDGVVAEVETPLFPPHSADPDYLLLRLRQPGRLFPEFALLPAGAVASVDGETRRVTVSASGREIRRLCGPAGALVSDSPGASPAGSLAAT
jgi:hypothetical protein